MPGVRRAARIAVERGKAHAFGGGQRRARRARHGHRHRRDQSLHAATARRSASACHAASFVAKGIVCAGLVEGSASVA